jgi:Protein of unknown function (DUF2894)
MAETQPVPPAAGDIPAAQVLLALRHAGAERVDPARLRYLEVLARRMQSAPPAVQQVLQGRWETASAALQQRCPQVPPGPPPVAAALPLRDTVRPLAQLNQYIRSASLDAGAAAASGVPDGDASELRSLRVFRASWSRIAAVDRVEAAVTRGPENAGPLNSHSLVLRSLALMRDVSPDYLRRFLSQMETLVWLEEAAQRQHPPVNRSRAKPKGKVTGKSVAGQP